MLTNFLGSNNSADWVDCNLQDFVSNSNSVEADRKWQCFGQGATNRQHHILSTFCVF